MDTTPITPIDPDEHRDYYFTFGYDNTHPTTGQRLHKSFVRVHDTYEGARAQMLAAFGKGWSSQYTDDRVVQKFGLTEVSMPGADEPKIAADTAAIRGALGQLRLLEREHGRQPSADLFDAAEAITAEIGDRLTRIDRLAGAR